MSSRTAIARYRHPVEIQKPKASATPDSFGNIDLSNDANWETHAQRRAEIIPTGGREFFAGQQVQSNVTHLLRFRQDALTEAIGPTYRIKFGSRFLNVERAYSVDERGREIEVQAIERTD